MTLEKTGMTALMPRMVDQFQAYLRELRVDDLKGSAGVLRLKEELLRRVNVAAAPYKVRDVLLKANDRSVTAPHMADETRPTTAADDDEAAADARGYRRRAAADGGGAERILNQDEIDSLLGFDVNSDQMQDKSGVRAIINSALVSYERLPMLEIVFDRLVRLMTTIACAISPPTMSKSAWTTSPRSASATI